MLEARIQNGKQLLEQCPDHIIIAIPRCEGVKGLEVGDNVIDCFGKVRQVAEITIKSNDIFGKAFVCFYVDWGNGTRCSGSYKQDQLVRTCALSSLYTSHELDDIEAYLNSEVG
jgi:hypothetical protein